MSYLVANPEDRFSRDVAHLEVAVGGIPGLLLTFVSA